jgi:hypothetical protein
LSTSPQGGEVGIGFAMPGEGFCLRLIADAEKAAPAGYCGRPEKV